MYKLEVAYKVLKYLVEEGKEFHIVITKESAEELFEIPSSKHNSSTVKMMKYRGEIL